MINQMINRAQLTQPSLYIMYPFEITPSTGTSGTHGVRNGLGWPGLVYRKTITEIDTITNASRVPMFTILPISSMGVRLPTIAARSPTRIVFFQGVRNLGWTAAKNFLGSRPSLAIA